MYEKKKSSLFLNLEKAIKEALQQAIKEEIDKAREGLRLMEASVVESTKLRLPKAKAKKRPLHEFTKEELLAVLSKKPKKAKKRKRTAKAGAEKTDLFSDFRPSAD